MFTRSQLEIKTIPELRDLCRQYGIKPTGNPGYKVSYITSLLVFPQIALQQLRQGKGLKSPGLAVIQFLEGVTDEMNSPTDEQAALIKIAMEGKRMNYQDRYDQENLLNLHKAKIHLEMAIGLLSQ
ncbi:hypothetical protein IQ276_016210 [Desmonostoc muscorum LEGE 12446]|uniref:Uncharacterized protein n=1 Tax=Desmonostoc muscorum LEGE 12446 TaxID=1828758 RepID=A0A8J6ZVN4_DESMC|nr:hypothetical protein [Desmonostoc muscorum]MCF2147941.1 hypothetical protein [Desmonostoc muscorum LEGE 12446]